MTREEICNGIELLRMKLRFLLGALLYDEDTHQGTQSLSVETVKQYNDIELESINVFVLEWIAASSEKITIEDEVTLKIIGEELKCRFSKTTPSFHK